MRPVLLALALLVLLAPAAQAASRSQIIRDCAADGRLDGRYSPSEIRDARQNLPADVDEYTNCRAVLRRAELAGAGSSGGGGGGGAGGGGGGFGGPPSLGDGFSGGVGDMGYGDIGGLLTPSSPEEQAALDAARGSAGGPIDVAGKQVEPGASAFAAYAARHELPWPLLAVLALLGLGALTATVAPIRRRVRAHRAQPA